MFRYFSQISAIILCSFNIKAQHKVVPLELFKADGDLEVTLWAQSPMLYNPTNMDVDKDGRIWVAEGVNYRRLEEEGSIQWPCNDEAPSGTPIMHVDEFVRGKGKFFITEYIPTTEKVNNKFPLILTTGRILAHYNVGAQTRRTNNIEWHDEDLIEIHPHDAEDRGINEQDWVGINSRSGDTVLRAKITDRVQPGVVYTTFHHPVSGANVITTDNSDWATNCPEFKVTAVQVTKVTQPSDWQEKYQKFSEKQIDLVKKNEEKVN